MKKENTIKKLKTFKICQLQHLNQYVINSDAYCIFQSYDSLVAIYEKKEYSLILGRGWDYSNTTLKHLYLFIDGYTNIKTLRDAFYKCRNKKKVINHFIKSGLIKYDVNMF